MVNIDLIMTALEETTGLSFDVDYPQGHDESLFQQYFSYDPWEGLDFGDKTAIYICNCYGTSYTDNHAGRIYLTSRGLYFDNWGDGFYDYVTIAHELTHALTMRYTIVNRLLTEGSGNYISCVVTGELSGLSEDFLKSYEFARRDISHVEDEITPENAELVFSCDGRCLGINEGFIECYHFGRDLCEYLDETFGNQFLRDYTYNVMDAGINARFGLFTEEDYVAFTALFKETFGDDVFVRFGEWYQENIAR